MSRPRLALAYYSVPGAVLLANCLFFVGPELRLPPGERGLARLSPPIPFESRCARWVAFDGPSAAPAGGRLALDVGVENCGDRVWPDEAWAGPIEPWGRHAVRFGARWSLASAKTPADYLLWRVSLPHSVLPGKRIDTTLYIPAPETPGRYLLEVLLMQELVAWFDSGRAKPLRLAVEVR